MDGKEKLTFIGQPWAKDWSMVGVAATTTKGGGYDTCPVFVLTRELQLKLLPMMLISVQVVNLMAGADLSPPRIVLFVNSLLLIVAVVKNAKYADNSKGLCEPLLAHINV